jgi:hypothetical protein
MYPPPRYPQAHNGYHPDNEPEPTAGTGARIPPFPSAPAPREPAYFAPTPSGNPFIPQASINPFIPRPFGNPPPPGFPGPSAYHRVPSPQRVLNRPSIQHRVPSPPQLSQRPKGQRETRKGQRDTRKGSLAKVSESQRVSSPSPIRRPPLESHRLSDDDRNLRHPRVPQSSYPRIESRYLSPSGRADSPSRGDLTQALRRLKSETPRPSRAPTPAHLTAQPLSNKPPDWVAPSDSTFKSTISSSPGALGDQAYQYRALQDLEFRLVKLLPERKTRIRCEIIHASLEDPPEYAAISYAWGDAGNTRRIELDGSLIPVTVSLYGALEALREKAGSVLVWVDALCIDQQNRDERSQQVQLMTSLYSTAKSVAIWLGPEEDDSALAIDLLQDVADQAGSPENVSGLISSRVGKPDLDALVSLFERDYWRRLWVVQEIFNATSITVYCGSTKLPWSVYELCSQTFNQHRSDLDQYFPKARMGERRPTISPNQFSYSRVLVDQGPGSLPDLKSYMELKEGSLLEVMRICRRKLASDAKDKLFGILGILPDEVRKEFRADYSLSVKDVYTEVVDYLLKTTQRLDVICDAIHFPAHTSSANLPSYVPDWSHAPETAAMAHKDNFSAAGTTKARCKFLDERLNKLQISAIYIDIIKIHGIAVGTLCTLADYLMAFLHWRALLLQSLENEKDESSLLIQGDFCRTLSLGQVPLSSAFDRSNKWLTVCYNVFASLLLERLPYLPLDQKLRDYVDEKVDIRPEDRRQFLQKYFGDRMMGRCFCRTENGLIGMGSGSMLPGDVVVVPLGCSTPILLRLEGPRGEYRFVGDVYIQGFMRGRAVDEWNSGERELTKYVLH